MSNLVKQDINFLHKPLWFQDVRHNGSSFVWNDKEGYEYRTGYKLPDKIDILILMYLMTQSQKNSYSSVITTTRRDILVNCDLPHKNNKYYKRVEDSLKRWKNIAVEFDNCFYENGNHITIGFSVIDEYEIDRKKRKVTVYLNRRWITKIQDSRYFKYLNFEHYKALKKACSRRLFEILSKSFYNKNYWSISAVKLGINLTVKGRLQKNGERIICASDVLTAIKGPINEINRLVNIPDVDQKLGIETKDLGTYEYKIHGQRQNRIITFFFTPLTPNEDNLSKLLELAKGKSKKLRQTIQDYLQKKGYKYVYWNILYANKNAKKNYNVYLQESLKQNWASEWSEHEAQRIQEENAKAEKERIQRDEIRKIDENEKMLIAALDTVEKSVINALWSNANVDVEGLTKLEVKFSFCELLREHLCENGLPLDKEIAFKIPLVNLVCDKYELDFESN